MKNSEEEKNTIKRKKLQKRKGRKTMKKKNKPTLKKWPA